MYLNVKYTYLSNMPLSQDSYLFNFFKQREFVYVCVCRKSAQVYIMVLWESTIEKYMKHQILD